MIYPYDIPMHAGKSQLEIEAHGFTPLLLAARMGHAKAVQRVLRHDAEILYTWGPVTQYAMAIRDDDLPMTTSL